MPLFEHIRTGHRVEADEAFIDAVGADKYRLVSDESPTEAENRRIAEAVAAKVELTDEGDDF